MERRHGFAAVGLIAAALLQGCSDTKAPIEPTPVPDASSQPVFSLSGYVGDSANRPMSGAKVEVMTGSRIGTVATTDDAGRFSIPGTFIGTVTVIASKDGYVPEARTVPFLSRLPPGTTGAGSWEVAFSLEPVGPPVNITGQYTVTLTADSACHIPQEARTRTYTSTIVQGGRSSAFLSRLSDARFFSTVPCPAGRPPETCTYNLISIGTAGDYAAIYAGIVERLGETTYLAVQAGTAGSFGPTGITAPLNGSFLYCPGEPYLIDQGEWACAGGEYCDSAHHQITIVRR